MLKTTLHALILLCISSIASAGLAADRVALVIGNGRYDYNSQLATPIHNAEDMGRMLESLGFEVVSGADLGKVAMDGKIAEFLEKARDAKVALFFYSGHGMQIGGSNYLLPVDGKLETVKAIADEVIDVRGLIQSLSSGRRSSIVILDASRPNPPWRAITRSKSRDVREPGLARVNLAPNMLIVHDAELGDLVADGLGRNSPFTVALLKYLPVRGLEITQAVKRVQADVYEATQGEQRPWSASTLTSDIYLNGSE